jgi:hypothetical protein
MCDHRVRRMGQFELIGTAVGAWKWAAIGPVIICASVIVGLVAELKSLLNTES